MLVDSKKAWASWLAAVCAFICMAAHAQTPLLQEVTTVADSLHAVPIEHDFDIQVAGTYQVTLTDLGAGLTVPAPLASVKFAITSGTGIVGTPATAAGSVKMTATPGKYTIHVVGAPGTNPGSGPIGITVVSVPDNTSIASFSDTLALPSGALPSNENTVDDTFTVAADGNYTVTLADLQLPQALTTLSLIITTSDGTVVTNPPLPGAGSTSVALVHGVNYRVFAVGQADPAVNAGLYSVTVTPAGGGTTAYAKTVAVGSVAPAQSATLAAGSYLLQLTDLGTPAALAGLKAVVIADGQPVAQLAAAGSSPAFQATAGDYQLFVLATAASAGSYAAAIAPQGGGTPAVSFARAVTATGSAMLPYSFDLTLAKAGNYNFTVTDFQLPAPLAKVSAIAVQGAAVVGSPLTSAGTSAVAPAAGPMSLLVFAQPASSGGLIDVNLTPTAGGASAFDVTQGVGQLFSARQLAITTAGSYAVNVADLKFPAQLGTFNVVVTQGSSQVGSIYGAGAFAFDATPGNYFVNFIAQPGGNDGAGTYALDVAPGPVLNLQSNTTTIESGNGVTLTWSTQNAASCTASGGWSGNQALSGSITSSALTSNTTFTLACIGNGVTVTKSVAVTVTAPPSKGGGGAIQLPLLLLLLSGSLIRTRQARVRAARTRESL